MNEAMHRAFPIRCAFLICTLAAFLPLTPALKAAPARIVEVHRIWDRGEHNAFTDLIRWRDLWWCTFRESAGHVGGDGVIRVLESTDGRTWTSAAALAEKDIDLRDPKFSVTPDGRLMIVCGGSVYLGTKVLKSRQSRVLFSSDGRTWTTPQRVLREGEWLWRVTWHQGTAYGVAYDSTAGKGGGAQADEWRATLYSSRDGVAWTKVSALDVTGRPNEATVRFRPGDEMTIMMRREAGDRMGWFGTARPPYTAWTWRPTQHRFGGPNFIAGPDGRWLVSTRDHTTPPPGAASGATTLVARLGTDGRLEPLATLPSGGDTSYAGLVWHDGQLWVSYYASHEGKSAIYVARVQW